MNVTKLEVLVASRLTPPMSSFILAVAGLPLESWETVILVVMVSPRP